MLKCLKAKEKKRSTSAVARGVLMCLRQGAQGGVFDRKGEGRFRYIVDPDSNWIRMLKTDLNLLIFPNQYRYL